MFAVCCLFHTKDAHFKKKVAKKNVLEGISQSNIYV